MLSSSAAIFATRLPAEMPAAPPWPSAWSGLPPFAFWIVSALRPRTLAELGVFHGLSYCCFCEEVVRAGLTTRCSGIDTWQGDEHNGRYGAQVLASLRAHHDPLYSGFSELLQMPFDAAIDRFEDGSLDLLHIDGFHTYEAVRHDFETWRPKLSPNAVVLFHDIDVRHEDFGVWRFWDEVRAGRPNFALHHSHGLGVLGMGTDYPAPVQALFDASPAEADAIRAAFEAMGAHISARHSMQRKLHDAIIPTGVSAEVLDVARRWRRALRRA
jgi:hypothetical protein